MMGIYEAGDPRAEPADLVTARELLDRGLEEANMLDSQPELQANMYNVIGRVYTSLGRYNEAIKLYVQNLQIRKDVFGDSHPSMAEGYGHIGKAYRRAGILDSAEFYGRRSFNLWKELLGPDHVLVSGASVGLANTLAELEKFQEANSLLERAL